MRVVFTAHDVSPAFGDWAAQREVGEFADYMIDLISLWPR
jgi:hypothetical protein